MAQEYKLHSFEKGDFTDPHGNYWCTAGFQGISEPVKWVVKDPTRVITGESYYGEIRDMTSKAGKPYRRFYKLQRPDNTGASQNPGSPAPVKKEWQPRDDDAIRAQWSIGQAVQLSLMNVGRTDDMASLNGYIESQACVLYAMVDRVKDTDCPKPAAGGQNTLSDTFPGSEPMNINDIPF